MLGSSRGPQESGDMTANLLKLEVRILFAVGGDATLRGAAALAQELQKRGQAVGVIWYSQNH